MERRGEGVPWREGGRRIQSRAAPLIVRATPAPARPAARRAAPSRFREHPTLDDRRPDGRRRHRAPLQWCDDAADRWCAALRNIPARAGGSRSAGVLSCDERAGTCFHRSSRPPGRSPREPGCKLLSMLHQSARECNRSRRLLARITGYTFPPKLLHLLRGSACGRVVRGRRHPRATAGGLNCHPRLCQSDPILCHCKSRQCQSSRRTLWDCAAGRGRLARPGRDTCGRDSGYRSTRGHSAG